MVENIIGIRGDDVKHEWRKKEKEFYLPKTKPEIIEIPTMTFITIEGEGNPNSENFSSNIQALYSIAYTIKMSLKKDADFDEYMDYTVYPLEGAWDLTSEGRTQYTKGKEIVDLKDFMKYKLMIRQPNFVSKDLFEKYKEIAYSKKKTEFIQLVQYEEIKEGKVCQMLHKGSYDDEPASFKYMEEYVEEQGLKRTSKQHKEIYISNPNKEEPSKQKTVLRFNVENDII